VAQDLRLQHVDPRVDGVGEDLTPRGFLEESLDAAVRVGDDDAELERVVDALERDGGERLLLLVEAQDRCEIDIAQRVSGDDQERLVERVLGELDGPRRARGGFLDGIADGDVLGLPRSEVAADGLRHECKGDDDVLESVLGEQVDDVLHARLADDRHHRFGLVRGQRPKARALAAGHHDGFHRVVLQALTA
jgi:hypothetical protein